MHKQELLVLLVLVLVLLGPTLLRPAIAWVVSLFRTTDRRAPVRLRTAGRWTWSDWALVTGTVTLGLLAAALSAHAHW
jgi:hypothetical protein